MSFQPNEQKIIALLQAHKVVPLPAAQQLLSMNGITMEARTQAQPKTALVLEEAGYKWSDEMGAYRSDRGYQSVIVFPQRIYLWLTGNFARICQNTNDLATWLGEQSNDFMQNLMVLSGMGEPLNIGKSQGVRTPPPSIKTHVDNALKTIKPGSMMPADKIIDLYKLAKETGSKPLMNLVKTLKSSTDKGGASSKTPPTTPPTSVKENIKKSDLKRVLEEIVKGVLKEMERENWEFPSSQQLPSDQKWVEDMANKIWPDPEDIGRGNTSKWTISRKQKAVTGEVVYLLKKRQTIERSRFLINRGTKWYYLDPKTNKWAEISASEVPAPSGPPGEDAGYANEQTCTAAVSGYSTPNAFSKRGFATKKKKRFNEGIEKRFSNPLTIRVKTGRLAGKTVKAIKDEVKGIYHYYDPKTGQHESIGGEENVEVQKSPVKEMTTTSAVTGYNVPAAFSRKGGSKAGVAGSAKLGYNLTPIGKKEMELRGDNLYENKDGSSVCRFCHKPLRSDGQIECQHCGKTQPEVKSGEASHAKRFSTKKQ